MPQLEFRWTSWFRVLKTPDTPPAKPAREDSGLTAWCCESSKSLGLSELARKVRVTWNPRMQTTAGRAWWPDRAIELNPKLKDCEPEELWRTLEEKQAEIHGRDMAMLIVTQFGFDADPFLAWLGELRSRGIDVSGPISGDTIFVRALGKEFDAVIAMYHDQGHIPVKLLGFHVDPATGKWTALQGVNITLGLPFVRTSVDHGTAFDIAGRNIASAQSMIEAIDYALSLTDRCDEKD